MKELQVLSIAEHRQQKESNLPLSQTGEVLFFVHLPHLPSSLWHLKIFHKHFHDLYIFEESGKLHTVCVITVSITFQKCMCSH